MKTGDVAPNFSVPTHAGEIVTLQQFRGKKIVVLYFYPQDGTPVCTAQACQFRDAYEEFVAAGAEVIGVSRSSSQKHEKFAHEYRLPFHLVADTENRLRKLFEVPNNLGIFPGRVTYVIDQQGIIRHIFNSQFQGQQHVKEALKIVHELQTQ